MLETSSDKPLYLQLVDELETTIREQMSPHDKLPSERELTDQHGVSRITVRLALQELEQRGLVYKKQGKGTFVSEVSDSVVDLSKAYSFTEQIRKMGKTPMTTIISFTTSLAAKDLAKEMGLEEGEEVYILERLRSADHVPMMLETSYIPVATFPDLARELLERKPLYDIFAEDYKQSIRIAEEEFYASLALDVAAKWLEIPEHSPVLQLLRKSYNAKNKLIEYTVSVARADQFRYKITHRQQKKNLFGINFYKKK